jgi:hypothetical protein
MKYLHFDLRALALMRICLSLVIITDLSIRMSDLEAFYSDNGAVPLRMVFDHAWNPFYLSIHTMSGLWQVQLGLFILSACFALMMLIGYRTRLFTFLSWLMMLSMHNRNIFILQGGDDLMRMVLFWAIFIPWGARYSCDRILDPERPHPTAIISPGTIAYLLQICYLYTGSALLKGTEWNTEYTAVYYAYSLDQIAYPVTKYLYYHPRLLSVLTFTAYYFELLLPLFFLIPLKHQWLRTAGVISIILFHSWNAMTLLIGIFPFAGMATSLGLLPSAAMDGFDRITAKIRKAVVSSFSGVAYAAHYVIRWRPQVYQPGWFPDKIISAFLVFLILFVADWNISNLQAVESKTPSILHPIAYLLRIDQSWGMFAPGVLKDDGWYVLEGTCRDGHCVNLLDAGKDLSYNKPARVVSMFKNDRWRKYAENYMFADNYFLRMYFCDYYRRMWNRDHAEMAVDTLKVIYMKEATRPAYEYAEPEKAVLCDCAD